MTGNVFWKRGLLLLMALLVVLAMTATPVFASAPVALLIPVTGVTVSPRTLNLTVGATSTLTATVAPSNANQAVTWSSDNTGVASVDSNGVVTAVAPGYAHITATTVGTWSSGYPSADSVTVTVTAATTPSTTPSSGSPPPPVTNTGPAAPKTYTTGNEYNVGNGPDGIAIDSSGDVWVANQEGSNVTELSSSGTTIGTYTVGSGTPSVSGPGGIAIDASGNVWVADGEGTVTELSSSGAKLGTYPVGTHPFGIAIDASGNVWVANEGDGTVTKLSPSGATLGTYSAGSENTNSPNDIAIDASGNVWVTNYEGNYVTEFSPAGAKLGNYKVGDNPYGIAIDSSGNVWVTNYNGNTVTELSSTGAKLGHYTGFYSPKGIAIDSSGDVLVVNSGDVNYLLGAVTELSSSGATLGTYPVDQDPGAIAIDASGNIWVTNWLSNTVTEIKVVKTIQVYVNGTLVQMDVAPKIVDGRILVQMRPIFEALGATVQWNAADQSIVATEGNTIIKLQIGSTTAYKNGAPVTLAAPPIIVNGHTLVPTRFVSEAFGYNVAYDAANMRVDITSGP